MKVFNKKRTFALLLFIIIALFFLLEETIYKMIYPLHYKQEIMEAANQYNIDPLLIAAIIRVESNYKESLVSDKGAIGLMQLMPATAQWIMEHSPEFANTAIDEIDLPTNNIRMGAWYIKYLESEFKPITDSNVYTLVAAAYNAGPGSVKGWLTSGRWDGKLETINHIPFGETRHYIQRVNYFYKKYARWYSDEIKLHHYSHHAKGVPSSTKAVLDTLALQFN